MGKIIHHDSGKKESTTVGVYRISSCGRFFDGRVKHFNITTHKEDVTCKHCLKKLDIKPEVDDEKKEFARFVLDNWQEEGRMFNDKCKECGSISGENFRVTHGVGCIVKKAEAYLESVKGS